MLLPWRWLAIAILYISTNTLGGVVAQRSLDKPLDPAIIQMLQLYYPELFNPENELVKRYNDYSFGLGKRAGPYSFGLGKRPEHFNFGLGKRAKAYNFGIGKRSLPETEAHPEDVGKERPKRQVETTEEERPTSDQDEFYDKRYKSYNFGIGKRGDLEDDKRAGPYSFGLGKRVPQYEYDDAPWYYPEFNDYDPELLSYFQENEDKRSQYPYSFGLGKRKAGSYSFGLGKRQSYGFGLGKRGSGSYSFGLGKRKPGQYSFGLGKREPGLYSFGLGKREAPDYPEEDKHTIPSDLYHPSHLGGVDRRSYDFGLGKRSKSYGFGLGKRGAYSFGLGKRSVTNEDFYDDGKNESS